MHLLKGDCKKNQVANFFEIKGHSRSCGSQDCMCHEGIIIKSEHKIFFSNPPYKVVLNNTTVCTLIMNIQCKAIPATFLMRTGQMMWHTITGHTNYK
jgi:hypothetical protein